MRGERSGRLVLGVYDGGHKGPADFVGDVEPPIKLQASRTSHGLLDKTTDESTYPDPVKSLLDVKKDSPSGPASLKSSSDFFSVILVCYWLRSKLMKKNDINSAPFISLFLDESIDITKSARLAVFGRYCVGNIIKEELIAITSLLTTTEGTDICTAVRNSLAEKEIDLKKIVSVTTDVNEFERGLIIRMKTAGWSTRIVAGQVDRSECAIKNCWEQWKREGTHVRKTGSGVTRKTTRREDRRIV
ncbi:DUF4371 domain-containing protein [Trichonephila clavipes]|nr:DUF4371 domain-containing protein [Trichonephila clavipes]